ncbi:carboxypeptidase-like regulatory domain-containing protein [Gaiella sp.]|uniref:carboxypeptidase-like regulatory domain-containing protein n=1 Tax=Gaiella sp. TaxID=2663207 RepID=UPI0032662AFF
MRRRPVLSLAATIVCVGLALLVASCGGNDDDEGSGTPVSFSQVVSVFQSNGCQGCHPGVNSSLDLQDAKAYDDLVGIKALEDPDLYRVVAGDPENSFLYLKVGGAPVIADIPAVGSRMPPGAPPISAEDMKIIHDWIAQGAKQEDGTTGGPEVTTPGTPPPSVEGTASSSEQKGNGTITGTVIDQARKPIAGAFVTLLLQGSTLQGGEEHYRVAVTDSTGKYTLADAPEGRFLLKAYAPRSIYVSRIVALDEGETEAVNFGLPTRIVPNPTISKPAVSGKSLSMTVAGSNLDGNYTLAVNPKAGITVELHNADNAPGRWSATSPSALPGPWVFLGVDEQCNVSDFLTVEG